MKRYGSELDRLRKVVQELELERNTLQRRLDERRNLASAIRRLPIEIWDTIFRQVVVSWPDHRKKPTNHSLYLHYQHSEMREECISGEVLAPPMVLSQVSSFWRNMVHSMPYLWASISVDVYGLNVDITPLLKIYYQRSENYPLTIEIINSEWKAEGGFDRRLRVMIEDEYYDPEEVGLDTFMFLMQLVSRCEVLSLDLPLGRFDDEEIPQLSFPILHTFICDRTLSPEWLLRAIQQAPRHRENKQVN
ncbi:hypothetical protein VNI00_013397 [Paramarasmius palmivorus]|uniref:F-box domain-containing protein n=1 Tax=Paramarasmius palmivorus TaxID=297713 RepID=A0AAW0BYZ1_9AGAR